MSTDKQTCIFIVKATLWLAGLSGLFFFITPTVRAHPGVIDENSGHVCESDCAEWGLMENEYHYHEETGASIRTLDNNSDLFDSALIEIVKGRILLQVEQEGRAWYVKPKDGFRIELPDGEKGFSIMASEALGITENDIKRIPAVGSTKEMLNEPSLCNENELANRLRGFTLLEVENGGRVWYVHPETCRRIYLKNGYSAYTIMHDLSLGISDRNLAKLPMLLNEQGRFNYCGDEILPNEGSAFRQRLCYTVKAGDTLGDLALKFFGSAEKYNDFYILGSNIPEKDIYYYFFDTSKRQFINQDVWYYSLLELNDRRSPDALLYPGTNLLVGLHSIAPYGSYRWSSGDFVINPKTGMPIYWSRNPDGTGVVNELTQLYSGPFYFIRNLRISEDWRNVSFLGDTKEWGAGCKQITSSGNTQSGHGYQFVVNGTLNSHYSCGWSFELLKYSPSGTHYAIRNNKEPSTDSDQFIVLSDIGNGPYYDFSDTIIWFDDETLIYRAHNEDVWRVVVNHEDVAVFNYLEDLRIEDRMIKFHARHDDWSWSDEQILL